ETAPCPRAPARCHRKSRHAANRLARKNDRIASRAQPAMDLRSVLLPAPLAPITATASPRPTSIETPNSAWKSPQKASRSGTASSTSGIGFYTHRDLRIPDHRLGFAVGDERAIVQYERPIDAGKQSMHHVLDPHDRHAARPDFANERDKRPAFVLGQAAGDFVEQQHLRLRS